MTRGAAEPIRITLRYVPDDLARAVSINANGWEFTGLEWGAPRGRPVLLLHGFPQTASSWDRVGPRLAAAGLRAIAIDQRGYSPGARPTDVAAYRLPALLTDIRAVIETLGGTVDLVGHDWGGVVGWHVAGRYPQLLRSWTAVSTANPLALNAVLAGDEDQRARFGYIRTFRREGHAETALLAEGAARLRAIFGGVPSPDRVAQDVAFFQQPGVLTLALNWYRAMSAEDAVGLGPVTVPTCYLWGSADLAFGRAAATRSAEFVNAPYTFVPLEGASHWLPDEVPDTIADAVARQVLGG